MVTKGQKKKLQKINPLKIVGKGKKWVGRRIKEGVDLVF